MHKRCQKTNHHKKEKFIWETVSLFQQVVTSLSHQLALLVSCNIDSYTGNSVGESSNSQNRTDVI